jgi:hypothetical protein
MLPVSVFFRPRVSLLASLGLMAAVAVEHLGQVQAPAMCLLMVQKLRVDQDALGAILMFKWLRWAAVAGSISPKLLEGRDQLEVTQLRGRRS